MTSADKEDVLDEYHYDQIMVLGDFNAKSTIWGGQRTDVRGKALSEFVIYKNMYIQNDAMSPPTFQSSNRCNNYYHPDVNLVELDRCNNYIKNFNSSNGELVGLGHSNA